MISQHTDAIDVTEQLSASQQRWVWQMLQATSREQDSPFAIEAEYPIVLGSAMASTSLCLTKAPFAAAGDIISHGSLWPRRLICAEHGAGGQHLAVGLIGNVATHPSWRNQGMMLRLLTLMAERSRNQGLRALVLWSELVDLYAKAGFVPMAKERRYFYHHEALLSRLSAQEVEQGRELSLVTAEQLSDEDLQHCVSLRPKVPFTLERSIAEFRQLLAIPGLSIFVRRAELSGTLQSFYLVDKGVDMPQVIHEWGVADHQSLAGELLAICEQLGYAQLVLLAPQDTADGSSLRAVCESYAFDLEVHPMALVKMLSDERSDRNALDRAFIWGLDGI